VVGPVQIAPGLPLAGRAAVKELSHHTNLACLGGHVCAIGAASLANVHGLANTFSGWVNTAEARYVIPAPLRILNTRLLCRPVIQGKLRQSQISDGGTKLATRCGGANP
jgi:hypothetical protein